MIGYFKKAFKKYKCMNIALKAGIWFTICNLLQKGISFITLPIFTRLLNESQYGTYSLYLSWLNIISVFTSMNLYYGVFNKALIKYEGDRNRYISSMIGLTNFIVFIFFVIYLVFKNFWNTLLGLSTPLMIFMFLEMFFTPSLQFWMVRARFEYKYRVVVLVTALQAVLNPLLGIWFVLISTQKVEARVGATVLIEAIICGGIMIWQIYKGKKLYVKKYWKYAFCFNFPLLPHYLSGQVLNQGDRIVIEKVLNAAAVGLYSIGYNVGMIAQLFTNAVVQSVTPWLYQSMKNNNLDKIESRIDQINYLIAISCIGIMLFAPEIVSLLAPPPYQEAIYVLPPITASVFFIYIYNIYSNIEFYFERRSLIAIGSIVAAILNIILNIFFVKWFGFVAAGYTTLFCYFVYAIIHSFFSNKICLEELGKSFINTKKFIKISILVILFTLIINSLYSQFYLRYLLVLIILGFGFIKRNIIIDIFKKG